MSLPKFYEVVVIIQARLTSTRLPKKVLKKIGKHTLMEWVVNQVNKASLVSKVVVASPHKIPVKFEADRFIGNEDDVLDRYYQCAKKYDASVIVRITSDCPFVDPTVIDMAVDYFVGVPLEYVCFAPFDGSDIEVFSFRLLKEAWKKAKDPYDREHITPYMRRKTKLSIDTMDDLKKARKWYGLQGKGYLNNGCNWLIWK